MKKTVLSMTMVAALLIFNLSCSKKSAAPPCNLITLVQTDGTNTTTTNITYNNAGKIATSSSTTTGSSPSTSNNVFTYAGNVIMKTTTDTYGSNPATTSTDSIALNSAGYVMADVQRSSNSSTYYSNTYTYDGNNKLLKQVTYNSYGSGSTTTYVCTYSNGDLIYYVGNGDTTYLYYNSKAAGGNDYLSLSNKLQYSAPIFNVVHQLSALKYGSSATITNLDYTYDSKGNIDGLKITSGSDIQNYTFQYDCGN